MGLPPRHLPLPGGQAGPYPRHRRFLAGHEFGQGLVIGPGTAAHPGQGAHRIEAGQFRYRHLFVFPRGLHRQVGQGSFPVSYPASQGIIEFGGIDGLVDMVVHAGSQAFLPVLGHGIGGHGDDR